MSAVYWLVRSGISVVGHTPRPVRNGLASTITSATYLGWRGKRRVTQQNMAQVLGLPATDRRVKRVARTSWSIYGKTASYLITLPYLDLDEINERIDDVSEGGSWLAYLRQGMAPGKGLIITTGHFGSWDLAGAIAARHAPLSAIADTIADPQVNQLLQGHRKEKNVDVIPVEGAARRVLAELGQGRAVAIVVDRPVSDERGVPVTFFGARAYVPGGSAAFAVKTGAAVMPGYFWFAPGNRYYLRAFPPMFPRPVSNADERTAEIVRLTQYMLTCQEEIVRDCPTQWFMFRPFWPATPAPVPPQSPAPHASGTVAPAPAPAAPRSV